ncbi:MAG: adenylate kinase [Acidimicrobiia bacterium]
MAGPGYLTTTQNSPLTTELSEVKLLFVGPPGAGKGTQAGLVAARLGIPHISTGEMFRHHVSAGTDLGKRVKAILEEGGYVPDDITVAMLAERLDENDAREGYILDGFPRTGQQTEALDGLIGRNGLDRVVLFEVDEDSLVGRMLARGRADDTEDTIRNRFKIYQEQTSPLIDIYEDRGLVVRVDGTGEIDEITERVLAAVRS